MESYMQSNLSISKFQSLPLEEKIHILRYQNNILTSLESLNKELIIQKGTPKDIFQHYIDNLISTLFLRSKSLNISDRSWSDFEEEAISENKRNSQYNFQNFFNGYSSTIASLEMLKMFKFDELFDTSSTIDKLLLVEQAFDIKLKTFISFNGTDPRIDKYDLKILSIQQIQKDANTLIQNMEKISVINLFDSKYRNYLRSRSQNYRNIEYDEDNTAFDTAIVDIDNLFDNSIFAQSNIISSLLCAYLDTYKLYRQIVNKDSEFKNFQSYKNSRLNSLKSVYNKKHEEKKLAEKIKALDDNKLLETYNSNKKYFEQNGIALQSLINQVRNTILQVFNQRIDTDHIVLTINSQNKNITGEFNGFKFFAFPDTEVKTVSSEAYFGFSLPLKNKDLILHFEQLLNNDTHNIKNEIKQLEKTSKLNIPVTNFYSIISMFEEFNVHYYQKHFFNNNEQKSLTVNN